MKLFIAALALAALAAGCECYQKPMMVRCIDGWGDHTYSQNVNICEQKDGVTRTEYGTRTGDCSCSYVHRERLCKEGERDDD